MRDALPPPTPYAGPKLTGEGSQQYGVWLSRETLDRLTRLSNVRGVTRSAIARRAIEKYCAALEAVTELPDPEEEEYDA